MPVIGRQKIKNMFPKNVDFFAGDAQYNTTTTKSIKRSLSYWIFKVVKWTKRRDCDNFSDLFMGICKWIYPTQAIGTIWVKTSKTTAHALNFYVYYANKKFNWAYIEPQTGEIYKLTNKKVLNWKPYYVRI